MEKTLDEDRLHELLFADPQKLVSNLKETSPDSDDEEPEEKKIKREESAPWHDEDDDKILVADALDAQGRRLPNGGINSYDGKYAKLVQEKYKQIVGTPKWAKIRDTYSDDSDDEILRDFGKLRKTKSLSLPSGILGFKRLPFLNNSTRKEGPIINVVEFHPTSTVSLVAGVSGVMSLLAVDGKKNEKLHSVAFRKFPIQCGQFTKDGNKALLGSTVSHFYSYDLIEAKSTQIQLPHGITRMSSFKLSPCGRYLAIAGRFGEIHLLCAQSWELLHTLKQNTHVTAISFTSDGDKLYSHGSESEVAIWDLKTRKASHKWIDDGCISGTSLAISPCDRYVAAGNTHGVLNIYETSDVLKSKEPKPQKSILNLTTRISEVKFNPTSEIIFVSSLNKPNAMRCVHVPSFKVFSNFPGNKVDSGHCSVANFSPRGGYLAYGTNTKMVYLYRIKHYSDY